MKLMLLIMPTIQNTVKPTANELVEPDDARPERVGDELDADAQRDRERGQPELAEELPAGAQVELVVEGAETAAASAADEQRRRGRVSSMVSELGHAAGSRSLSSDERRRRRAGTRPRPRRRRRAGPARRVDPPGVRAVDDVEADRRPAGRAASATSAISAAATKTTTIGPSARPDAVDEAHAAARSTSAATGPGPGTAPRSRATSRGAAGAGPPGRRASRIASMMIRPIAASRPRRSRATSWPACRGGCRRPCSAAAGRTGSRSC